MSAAEGYAHIPDLNMSHDQLDAVSMKWTSNGRWHEHKSRQ